MIYGGKLPSAMYVEIVAAFFKNTSRPTHISDLLISASWPECSSIDEIATLNCK
jgi:hypothetical protein